jgi:membrane protein insertase Oxa1/YidC/SpoIIIJ
MDAFSLIIVILVIYGISRITHHFNDSKKKLNELDKKLDEIKELYYQDKKK